MYTIAISMHDPIMQAEVGIRSVLKQSNITVESRTFQTGKDPTNTVDDLFVSLQYFQSLQKNSCMQLLLLNISFQIHNNYCTYSVSTDRESGLQSVFLKYLFKTGKIYHL